MVTVITQLQHPIITPSTRRSITCLRGMEPVPVSPISSRTSSGVKKHVAFADELGLELVSVKLVEPRTTLTSSSMMTSTSTVMTSSSKHDDVMPPISSHSAAAVIQTLSILANQRRLRQQQQQRCQNQNNGSCQASCAQQPCYLTMACPASSSFQWPEMTPRPQGARGHYRTQSLVAPAQTRAPPATLKKTWELEFCQPVYDYERFTRQLAQRNVALENACINDDGSTVSGFVKMRNICYEKHVFARYSTDNWSSYRDVPANYVLGVPGDAFDTFKFEFNIVNNCYAANKDPSRVEFCLCYRPGPLGAPLAEYWDNNAGHNYAIVARTLRASINNNVAVSQQPATKPVFQEPKSVFEGQKSTGKIHQIGANVGDQSCRRQSANWDAFAAWKHYQEIASSPFW